MAIVHVDAALGDDVAGDGSAGAPFQTITRGITEAVAGDEVNVAAGNYDEAVNVNKSITMSTVGAVTADSWASAAANTVTWDGAFAADTNFQFNGPALLRAATQFSGANVEFLGTLNSVLPAAPQALTVNATTLARFGNDAADTVGVTASLLSIGVGATGVTSIGGAQIRTNGNTLVFNNPVVLAADLTINELAGNVVFNNVVDSDATPRSLTVNTVGGGDTRFNAAVGASSILASLTTDAPGDTFLAGASVQTTGNQTYADDVVLDANVTLTALNVQFNGNINSATLALPRGLTVNASATTQFGDAAGDSIGGVNPLSLLATNAGGTTRLNAATISANGATITFADPVVLTTDTTVTEAGAGAVSFLSTINSDATPRALTVNTPGGGNTVFGGAIGTTSRLSSLTTDTLGTTRIGAGNIQTNGVTVTFNDPVVLTAALVIDEAGAGAVSFLNTVNSDGTPRALTVNTAAGDTIFAGNVGAVSALASITTNNTGLTRFSAAQVATTGNQTYNDAVRIETATTTFAGAGVSFVSTLDSAPAAGNNVVVNTSGNGATRFGGAVGGIAALGALTTNADGTTSIEGGAVTTTGTQQYLDAVTITASTTFAGGSVLFGGTLNASAAGQNVVINSAGVTRFGGNVGAVIPPQNLTTNAGGQTNIAAALVRTALNQTYNDRIVLEADTATESTTGNIVFNSTVDAANDGNGGTSSFGITVRRPNGSVDVVFNGVVGGNGSGTDDPQGVEFARLEVNGPLRLITNITATQLIEAIVAEGAAASLAEDLTVQAGVSLLSGTDINFAVGDDILLAPGSTVIATAGTLTISGDFGNNDALQGTTIDILGATGPVGAGTAVLINGGADDDFLNLQFARFRAGDNIIVNGAGNGTATVTLITETVSFANPCNAAIVTGTSTIVPFGDSLTLFDTGQAGNQRYDLNSAQIARSGGPTFQFQEIQQVELLAGAGADQLVAQMPGLPSVVQFDGGGNPAGTSDQLDVIGSAGADLITVGPVSGVSPHRPFEIANVEALRVQGGDGDDTIVNNTAAFTLLEGQGGNDTIIGGPQADVIYGGGGVDRLYGLDGGDFLFPDHDFNGTVNGVLTIADGDFSAGGNPLIFPGDSAIPLNNPGVPAANLDTVCGIETLIDGGAQKDVLTWLNAQILPVSTAAINQVMGNALATLDAANVNTAPPLQAVALPQLIENPDFEHWLDNLYQALLGRDFAPSEFNYYFNAQANGASRDAIVQGFLNSPERRAGIVDDWYDRYLGRSLDAGGRAYWLGVWAQTGAESVEAGILGSGEFLTRVGGTNQAWVDAMYMQVLGRTGSAGERQFWVDKLATTTRPILAQAFVSSDEHRLLNTAGWYRNYLGRSPETGGAQFWLGKLKSGVKPESVQSSILVSMEFQKMVW